MKMEQSLLFHVPKLRPAGTANHRLKDNSSKDLDITHGRLPAPQGSVIRRAFGVICLSFKAL